MNTRALAVKNAVLLALGVVLAGAPLRAQAASSLGPFLGQWQGNGTVRSGDEPEQRFQCRLSLTDQGPYVRFEGRCASAQGSTSFLSELSEPAPGEVEGINRALAETTLPQTLRGQVDADGGLTLASDEGVLRFIRAQGDLQFQLRGQNAEGLVQLQAR